MNSYDFDQLTHQIKAKLDRYSENIDWLTKDTNNQCIPFAKPQQQPYIDKSNSVANLSPQEFIKAYKKNPDQLEKQVFQELGVEPQHKISNYQTEQPQSQAAIVNPPPRFSSQEVLARVKNDENLADILSELSQGE